MCLLFELDYLCLQFWPFLLAKLTKQLLTKKHLCSRELLSHFLVCPGFVCITTEAGAESLSVWKKICFFAFTCSERFCVPTCCESPELMFRTVIWTLNESRQSGSTEWRGPTDCIKGNSIFLHRNLSKAKRQTRFFCRCQSSLKVCRNLDGHTQRGEYWVWTLPETAKQMTPYITFLVLARLPSDSGRPPNELWGADRPMRSWCVRLWCLAECVFCSVEPQIDQMSRAFQAQRNHDFCLSVTSTGPDVWQWCIARWKARALLPQFQCLVSMCSFQRKRISCGEFCTKCSLPIFGQVSCKFINISAQGRKKEFFVHYCPFRNQNQKGFGCHWWRFNLQAIGVNVDMHCSFKNPWTDTKTRKKIDATDWFTKQRSYP